MKRNAHVVFLVLLSFAVAFLFCPAVHGQTGKRVKTGQIKKTITGKRDAAAASGIPAAEHRIAVPSTENDLSLLPVAIIDSLCRYRSALCHFETALHLPAAAAGFYRTCNELSVQINLFRSFLERESGTRMKVIQRQDTGNRLENSYIAYLEELEAYYLFHSSLGHLQSVLPNSDQLLLAKAVGRFCEAVKGFHR